MASTNFQHPRDYVFFPALFFTIKYYICLIISPPSRCGDACGWPDHCGPPQRRAPHGHRGGVPGAEQERLPRGHGGGVRRHFDAGGGKNKLKMT